MWNYGRYVLWQNIVLMRYEYQENGLKLLPKIRHEHIHLTTYSVMIVDLSAQSLSSTVVALLTEFGSIEAFEAARLFKKFTALFTALMCVV